MQTPPNNSIGRPNFMQFRRGADGEQESFRNESMFNRMGSKYPYKKQPPNQKQIMNKQVSQMKKQLSFLQNTKWMFQNNDVLVVENFCPNPL